MSKNIAYIVIVKTDGSYSLASRQVFLARSDAWAYANSCPPGMDALVIPGDFQNLRVSLQEDMSEHIGYLMGGTIAVCLHCGNCAHVSAHSENTKLSRGMIFPYQQTCNMCGDVIVSGDVPAFGEIYSRTRQAATVREMKAIPTPITPMRPTQYCYVAETIVDNKIDNRNTDIDELLDASGDVR